MATNSETIADPTRLGSAASRAVRLMVYIEGKDRLESHAVNLPEAIDVTVGRSRGCTITVNSERISRRHLRIWREGDEVRVEDLESRNGTRVNGDVITEAKVITAGDEVTARPVTIVLTTSGTLRWRRNLCDPGTFSDRLRAEVDRATRYKRAFSVGVIQFDGEQHHIDQALEDLSGRIRQMDSIGDFGDREVALLLPELDADAGNEALERIIRLAQPSGFTLRAGIASFPDQGAHGEDLLAAARRASIAHSNRPVVRAKRNSIVPTDVVAVAPATKSMFALIDKVAKSTMTVLVNGETGAGKEIAARAIHDRSHRNSGPFVVLNCACLPSTLLESELFGHEKGAFTGADAQKTGFFEAASGGTLFLDEIGEIEPSLQAKLLRVLESHKVVRVGGTREIPVDVRVVCATNRDLEVEVSEGRFRSDLFYRIAGFTVVVPPLRERRADIEPLVTRFIAAAAAAAKTEPPVLSPQARSALLSYAWPGNIRELRNAVERATVLASTGLIEPADLPASVRGIDRGPEGPSGQSRLDAVERDAIVAALKETGGNQTHAARNLGLTRRALIYRMEKHGLKKKPS